MISILVTLLWIVIGLSAVLLIAGQAGFLQGRAPTDLGVGAGERAGRLKPPSPTPNSVSSQAALYDGDGAAYARIEPLPAAPDAKAAMQRLRAIVAAMPGARIVDERPDYLYAQFTTRWLKFVDDAEFWAPQDKSIIEVRSASRLGAKDFGVNRARIEAIRARLGSAG